MVNFFSRYRPIADKWEVYNSTGTPPVLVAEGRMENVQLVVDAEIWDQMRRGGSDES